MAKRQDTGPGPSQRQLRVAELIRHALSDMLSRGDIYDDVLRSRVITVPEVRMSPDLRIATCYIMPLGGQDEKPVLAALEKHRKYLRTEIAHRVNLKFAPDLRFRRDETFDEAARIDALLRTPRVLKDTGVSVLMIDQEGSADLEADDHAPDDGPHKPVQSSS